MPRSMPLCQVGFSVLELQRSARWYEQALGFVVSGRTNMFGDNDGFRALTGMPGCSAEVIWMVDQQDWFQVEFFEYDSPRARPQPADWTPADLGWTTLGVHVADFSAALERIERTSGRLLTQPLGEEGSRRVCLRDPDGVLIELMEDDPVRPGAPPRPRPEIPVAVRSVTASVPSLAQARRLWVDTLDLEEAHGVSLHTPAHEALWGLEGAERETLLLWAGDILVELVEYRRPAGRAQPAGQYVGDQGFTHAALGSRHKEDFALVWQQAHAAGYRGQITDPWDLGFAGVIYLDDGWGSVIELMHCDEHVERSVGFHPLP